MKGRLVTSVTPEEKQLVYLGSRHGRSIRIPMILFRWSSQGKSLSGPLETILLLVFDSQGLAILAFLPSLV